MSFHYKVYFESQNVQIFILNSTWGGGGGPLGGPHIGQFYSKRRNIANKNTKELQDKL